MADDLVTGSGGAPSGDSGGSSPAPSAAPPSIDSIFAEVEASLGSPPEPTQAAGSRPSPATPPSPTPASSVPPSPFANLPPARPPAPPAVDWETQARAKYGDWLTIVEGYQQDPIGTHLQVMQFLQQHPQYGPQLTSQAGRMLSAARGRHAAEPEPDVEPGPDIETVDEKNRPLLLYSAEQTAKREAWLRNQINKDLEPFRTDLQTRQRTQQETAELKERFESVKGVVDAYARLPHFQKHRAAIAAKQKEIWQAMPEAKRDTRTALGMAYAIVLAEKEIPQAQVAGQQTLLTAAAKQLAGASHDPSVSAPAQPKKIVADGRPKSQVLDDVFAAALAEAR